MASVSLSLDIFFKIKFYLKMILVLKLISFYNPKIINIYEQECYRGKKKSGTIFVLNFLLGLISIEHHYKQNDILQIVSFCIFETFYVQICVDSLLFQHVYKSNK
jgi:hypothetical protein